MTASQIRKEAHDGERTTTTFSQAGIGAICVTVDATAPRTKSVFLRVYGREKAEIVSYDDGRWAGRYTIMIAPDTQVIMVCEPEKKTKRHLIQSTSGEESVATATTLAPPPQQQDETEPASSEAM